MDIPSFFFNWQCNSSGFTQVSIRGEVLKNSDLFGVGLAAAVCLFLMRLRNAKGTSTSSSAVFFSSHP